MAYKTISGNTAIALTKNYNEEAKEYEAEKDKAKKKERKASLDLRAPKILAALMTDIADYDKNASERYLNIDNRLARAMNLIKTGKEALATYIKTRKVQDLVGITVLPAQFAQLALEEKQDDKAYCAAQTTYRNNPISFDQVKKISGDKYIKPMFAVRQGTIDEGKKHIQPKLEKIDQLAKMAEQLATQAQTLQKGDQADLTDLRKVFSDALADADKPLTEDKKGFLLNMCNASGNSLRTLKTQAATNPMTKDALSMVDSMQSNIIGNVKQGKVIVKRFQDAVKDAKASAPKTALKDPEIAKALVDLPGKVTELEKLLTTMAENLKEAMAVASKTLKANKK